MPKSDVEVRNDSLTAGCRGEAVNRYAGRLESGSQRSFFFEAVCNVRPRWRTTNERQRLTESRQAGTILENAIMQRKIGTQPHVLEETAGKKAYCQCGLSAGLPYCDGSHKQCDEEIGPVVCTVESDGKKAVCMCFKTGNSPWCDGSHKNTD